MKKFLIASAMTLCFVSLAAVAFGDTLVLRDGTRVPGTLVGVAAGTVTFRGNDGVAHRYASSRVDSLQFGSADHANSRGNANGRNHTDRNPANSDNGYASVEAPAGTELVVRTVELIDSRAAAVDQTFSTLVEQDVTDRSGRVIIPQGSSAQLIIRELSSGSATGSPEMVLDLQSITVAGRRYQISTTDLSRNSGTGIGANTRTAEAVGGGAALGTIIGAIAGGGKGAAIGGLIGGAGGAGAQVATRGHDVRVPVETVLKFRLDHSVTLQATR